MTEATIEHRGHCCGHGRWSVRRVEPGLAEELARETGFSLVFCRIMVGRGITDAAAARVFIEPSLDRDWLDPYVIPGMREGAEKVAAAIRASERIVVFGDFDLDGISSAALMARGLAAMGAQVEAIIPNRFAEGYGLSAAAMDRALALGPKLLVTVDCGVSSSAEVAQLLESGVDVVVTDHHEPGEGLPVGIPVVNPKLDPGCPSFSLAGAGVALKFVQAVGDALGTPDGWRSLTDLAALGTIADIVPLIGENRALVADGLARIAAAPRAGIAALAEVAGVSVSGMRAQDVAFGLAPRLNAAGRMGSPDIALDLMLADDPATAEKLASALDEQNRNRQIVEQKMSEEALQLAEQSIRSGDRVLVLAREGWHEGVKGIVASRLATRFGLPCILFIIRDGLALGSGRSAGNVDLYSAVEACSSHLVRFGGHAAAVGVTLAVEEIEPFRESLRAHLATLPAEEFVTERLCDVSVSLDDVSVELGTELALLEPFGHGNPAPLFEASSVFMTSRQRVGKDSNHLRFTAFDGTNGVGAIAFRCRDIEQAADMETPVDLAFELSVDTWRGNRRAQLMVRDFATLEVEDDAPAAELVEELFSRADAIVAREEYSGITDAESFHTKLAGVTFEERQDVISRLKSGDPLAMRRQPENPYDANAIALFEHRGAQVGFLNRRLAQALAPALDAGVAYDVEVTDVTGGVDARSWGVNVRISRRGDVIDPVSETSRAEVREELAQLSPEALERTIITQLIGDRSLLDAQRESLEVLAAGRRCLTVMATGRGKSLIFHAHAARLALKESKASVFVFPLRALVADQHFHLAEMFMEFGLTVRVLTGESSSAQRDEIFAGLAEGEVSVVLTTPEFFEHNSARFAATERIGFVVVDEAHHVGRAKAGHRPAYARLGEAIASLGDGVGVFACTATASAEIAAIISESLGIDVVLEDPAVRDNLALEDRRGIKDKEGSLLAIALSGGKTIVYSNSREQTVRIARMLRKRIPALASRVVFYNGGLGRQARHAVEQAFRNGDLSIVVATSAFGEGVNIPDIRNVVLYHLPFNEIEFNQMSGRAGRDGAPSAVHLLFGAGDGRINDLVLSTQAPAREDMAALYLTLRDIQGSNGEGFEVTNAELAELISRKAGRDFTDKAVSVGLSVFRELGLLRSEGHGPYRRLTVVLPPPGKMELSESVRYSEGLEEIAEFREFRTWALGATAEDLLARFNRPILPSTTPTTGQETCQRP